MDEDVWQEFKRQRKQSGKTWNQFIKSLIIKEYESIKNPVTGTEYKIKEGKICKPTKNKS